MKVCIFVVLFMCISGCSYYAQLDSSGSKFYGPALPASILELVEAERIQNLAKMQVKILDKLGAEDDHKSTCHSCHKRAGIQNDAQFIQSLMQSQHAHGKIENLIRSGVRVKIYEMDESGERGAFKQELYLPPKSVTSYMLENGKKYVFVYTEQRSLSNPKSWYFRNGAYPGWVCQYAPY